MKPSQNSQDEAVHVYTKAITDPQALLGHPPRTWVTIIHAFSGAEFWTCGSEIKYRFELAL